MFLNIYIYIYIYYINSIIKLLYKINLYLLKTK